MASDGHGGHCSEHLPATDGDHAEDLAYFTQPPGLIEVKLADGKTVQGYEVNSEAENLKWLPA
jgi:hypothetical protein